MPSYSPANTDFRYVKVPLRDSKERRTEPCGTTDTVTANKIADMVDVMVEKHAWDVLERVTARPRAKNAPTLGSLYATWTMTPSTKVNPRTNLPMEPGNDERLEFVRQSLNAVDLEPLVAEFEKVMRGPTGGIEELTVHNYVRAVRSLIEPGKPFMAPELSTLRLVKWKDAMTCHPNTVIRRARGMGKFTAWLKENGYIVVDPMLELSLPESEDALPHYLDVHEAEMLADAQDGDYAHVSALMAGTGMETSSVAKYDKHMVRIGGVRRRDVDLTTWEIRAPGRKTYNRDRIVKVATWARPHVKALVIGKHPDALLFEPPSRYAWEESHRNACDHLAGKGHRVFHYRDEERKDYTMRDQRHTWAVYAVRGGWPIEAVARVLGHVNGILCHRVYGRFVPTTQERDMFEERAHAAAEARRGALKLVNE